MYLSHTTTENKRTAAVLLVLVVATLGLVSLLALAIDIGMVAMARTQAQNAADSSAAAAARTINGDSDPVVNYNLNQAPKSAVQAAIENDILGNPISGDPDDLSNVNTYTWTSGDVTVEVGAYAYIYDDINPENEGFEIQFPRTNSDEPYSAVRTTVEGGGDYIFARIFGADSFGTRAQAAAVHRPRDVVIVMDLSGSMRFQSLPGTPMYYGGTTAAPSSTSRPRVKSLNPETVYPKFGHYSDIATAALYGNTSYSTGDEVVDPANITVSTDSGPPIVNDFFQNDAGVDPDPETNLAFSPAADGFQTSPGGDNYLREDEDNAYEDYAKDVEDVVGSTSVDLTWEREGYNAYRDTFYGYTEGPRYWGKTFFIWPPDPRGSSLDASDFDNHLDNGAKDWRQRFFIKYNRDKGQYHWLDQNTVLFDEYGYTADINNRYARPIMNAPGERIWVNEHGYWDECFYLVNYAAIFKWLREGPRPLPPRLRAGRIKYYDSIPDPTGDTWLNWRFWTDSSLSDPNEQFWRDYINFVLGITGTTIDNWDNEYNNVPATAFIGNGDMYEWGTVRMNDRPYPSHTEIGSVDGNYPVGFEDWIDVDGFGYNEPDVGDYVTFGDNPVPYEVTDTDSGNIDEIKVEPPLVSAIDNDARIYVYNSPARYMNYEDNPYRPRHQFWFGPMTMIDFLGNYNTSRFWWPGNVHEAQNWACKVGIQTAIDDIERNHPSDFIGLTFFSSPKYSQYDDGQHNRAVVPLGRNYQQLKDSLWFPPSTVTGGVTEITPYDADFEQVPRAHGGTAPGMGFMIAYNMLSSSVSNLRFYTEPTNTYRGHAGGLGRKGADRMIIFETDGAPNTSAVADLIGTGADSYYEIRVKNPVNLYDSQNVEWPDNDGYNDSDVFDVVEQICALESDDLSGFATERKPVLVHCIAYGNLFDPTNSVNTDARNDALSFLHDIATIGNTATGDTLPLSRRVYGSPSDRINGIRDAFTDIMQSGVQISLIE